jgi:kynurenine formamidase
MHAYHGPRNPNGIRTTDVFKICPRCHNESIVSMLTDHYDRWQSGELIQRAVPEMTPENRETLITGLCSPCQAIIFAYEED